MYSKANEWSYSPFFAIDSKVDDQKDFYWASNVETNPFLLLDLGSPALIKIVAINSVKSKGINSLKNLAAYVGNTAPKKAGNSLLQKGNLLCGILKTPHTAGQLVKISCAKSIKGRYLILTKSGKQQISISEIKINNGLGMIS